MKSILLCLVLLTLAASGCVWGNAPLLEMTATDIRDTCTVGVTTKDEVYERLGEPMEISSRGDQIVWEYQYQKMSARYFVLFVPHHAEDDVRGRIILEFNKDEILNRVSYFGDQ